MKKAVITIGSLFCILISLFLVDRKRNRYYQAKFRQTELNTPLQKVVADWGRPDDQFLYPELGNSIVAKYRRDYLGWDTFVFIFSPEDSLLVSKHIDD